MVVVVRVVEMGAAVEAGGVTVKVSTVARAAVVSAMAAMGVTAALFAFAARSLRLWTSPTVQQAVGARLHFFSLQHQWRW